MPLSVSDGLSAWIKDFMKSDAPQFKGKTKEEIVKMAIAAFTDAGGKLKEDKMKFKELREKYRSKFPSSLVAAAVKIAIDMGGNMTGAHKKIEAMKKGLANDPMVKDALRQANESVTEVKEGTWDIPDTKTKLQKLMDLVSKPFFGTTEKDVDRYLKIMPFGDDELYDDLGVLYFIPGSTKSKKFPKTDLNQVAMDSLNGRWLTAKKKGNGWDITHINFDIDMDETIKRKSGNIRPGRRMKVEL